MTLGLSHQPEGQEPPPRGPRACFGPVMPRSRQPNHVRTDETNTPLTHSSHRCLETRRLWQGRRVLAWGQTLSGHDATSSPSRMNEESADARRAT